jgi:hypothetical protein
MILTTFPRLARVVLAPTEVEALSVPDAEPTLLPPLVSVPPVDVVVVSAPAGAP